MSPAPRPVRPSRRAVLGGALALPVIALTGCREDEKPPPAPRTPAGVELTPLTSSGRLMAPHPVLVAEQTLAAGTGRPLGHVLATYRDYACTAAVVTVATPMGHPVPIAKDTVNLLGWTRADAAVLLAERPAGDGLAYDLHLSKDLVTWGTATVSGRLRRPIVAAGDGVVVFGREGRAIRIATLADDGTLTDLAPIAIPDGQRWEALLVAVHEATTVVVCERPGADPFLVSSQDRGKTWSAPVTLSSDGANPEPTGIAVQDGVVVVTGTHAVDPGDVPGTATFSHPVAWRTGNGTAVEVETIPLPVYGEEGHLRPDGTPIDPQAPWSRVDYPVGSPCVAADGGDLTLGLGHDDSYVVARRHADGTWKTGGRTVYLPRLLRSVAADDGGAILRADDMAWVHATGAQEAVDAIGLSAGRSLTSTGPRGLTRAGGIIGWRTSTVVRRPMSTEFVNTRSRTWFSVEADSLEPLREMPVRGDDAFEVLLEVADDGTLGLFTEPLGAATDETGRGIQGWVRGEGGGWTAVTGLPTSGTFEGTTFRRLAGSYHLSGAVTASRHRDDDTPWTGTLWTSADARAWKPDGRFPARSVATDIARLGEELIAVGSTWGDDDINHAVMFRRQGEQWTPTRIGKGAESEAHSARLIAGALRVHGTQDGQDVEWAIAADGTAKEVYRSTDEASRGSILDLGDGALLATGWRRAPTGGGGAVIWVSADGGKHWDVTPIPGEAGRYDDAELVRDGDDVVVLVETPDGPHAYRIIRARDDVLTTTSVRGASDGGG